ncbi:MAG: response regulator [Deltaproteobacteria bacterium]|nr:response regulator [Deltaproteobacteria bacterium]
MRDLKILVVEDNPLNMELVTDLLENVGYTVIQAENAEKGIELATTDPPPDLILLDIGLPGMDGLTAARLLKQNSLTMSIPIVALTASAMQGDDIEAMEAGCNGFISKPINTREFVKEVTLHIRPYKENSE